MITFSSQQTIDRPPARVRAFFADTGRYHEWMPVTDVRVLSGAPNETGARMAMTMPGPAGRRYPMEFEVTEATPERFVWRVVRGGPLRGHYRAELEPLDGGHRTRVTYAGELQLTGLWRLLTPLVAREVASGEAQELKRVKELVEAEPETMAG